MAEPADQFTSFTQKVFTTLFGILIVAGLGWAMSAQTDITVLKEQRTAIIDILVQMQASQLRLETKLNDIERKLDRIRVSGVREYDRER